MIYLKGNVLDDFQIDRIIYKIIDFDLDSNETIEENVIIYDDYYSRYRIVAKEGDVSVELIEEELNDNFIETTELEFNQDIDGLAARFGQRD